MIYSLSITISINLDQEHVILDFRYVYLIYHHGYYHNNFQSTIFWEWPISIIKMLDAYNETLGSQF